MTPFWCLGHIRDWFSKYSQKLTKQHPTTPVNPWFHLLRQWIQTLIPITPFPIRKSMADTIKRDRSIMQEEHIVMQWIPGQRCRTDVIRNKQPRDLCQTKLDPVWDFTRSIREWDRSVDRVQWPGISLLRMARQRRGRVLAVLVHLFTHRVEQFTRPVSNYFVNVRCIPYTGKSETNENQK